MFTYKHQFFFLTFSICGWLNHHMWNLWIWRAKCSRHLPASNTLHRSLLKKNKIASFQKSFQRTVSKELVPGLGL